MNMKRELEKYIQNNLDVLDRSKPDPAVLNRILQQMKPAEKPAPRGILITFRTMALASKPAWLPLHADLFYGSLKNKHPGYRS
jgi:hypothetical protein